MRDSIIARRNRGLSAAFPAPHFPSELGENVIAFDSGFAFPDLLPDLTACAHNALTAERAVSLQYSPNHGQPALRAWIAGHMNEDGCNLTADDILIVNGAKHGLELVCKLLLDEGDCVVVTAPTYFSAVPIFSAFGAQFLEVGLDESGLDVDELESLLDRREGEGLTLPKFIYNVTDFHNPSGTTLSRERRQALVALAERRGIFLLEDNPYRKVRFDGDAIPTLKALDKSGVVIHTGTFSKLVAPGLRIGWVAADKGVIARLIQLKADGGTSALLQNIVLEFCASAEFPRHVARVRETYGEHRDRMIVALKRELPLAELRAPDGGYYIWVELPAGCDADDFARRTAQKDVNILAGSKFFAVRDGYPSNRARAKRHIRLSYSFATPDQIDEGVRRLGDVYRGAAWAG